MSNQNKTLIFTATFNEKDNIGKLIYYITQNYSNADILIIDEVLSVGDIGFQSKCIKKMEEYRQAGTTIVFVSHNLSAVQDLCNKTIARK